MDKKEIISQGPGYEIQKSAKGCALYQVDVVGGKWRVADFSNKASALSYFKLEFELKEDE